MKFSEFNFHPAIEAAITRCGFSEPTEIQNQAIPPLLDGKDLLGLAQTGTGKTAAFVLPTLQKLIEGKKSKKIKALILTPTRELAEQVHENIVDLSYKTGLKSCPVYGGVSKFAQIKKIYRGMDIVVACPGRLLDLIENDNLDLSQVATLILDEADQMVDKGFLPDIRRIIKNIPKQRQTLVFSATMPKEIRKFVEEILADQVVIQIDYEKPSNTISHVLFQVNQPKKTVLLQHLLANKNMQTTLIFTRTKHKAQKLAQQLKHSGFKATSLQGNMSQQQRRVSMEGFRKGKFNIMVATDIAARGIDVANVSHVVNYDIPDTIEAYTHRTGRTGRAKQRGEAFTFATKVDGRMVKAIERKLGGKVSKEKIDGLAATGDDFTYDKEESSKTGYKKRRRTYSASPKKRRYAKKRPLRGAKVDNF